MLTLNACGMQDFASRILKNLATNAKNRTRLYKAELRAKKKDWTDTRNTASIVIATRPRPPSASTVATHPPAEREVESRRPDCLAEYRRWIEQIGASDVKCVQGRVRGCALAPLTRSSTPCLAPGTRWTLPIAGAVAC